MKKKSKKMMGDRSMTNSGYSSGHGYSSTMRKDHETSEKHRGGRVSEPMKTTAISHNDAYKPKGLSPKDGSIACAKYDANTSESLYPTENYIG